MTTIKALMDKHPDWDISLQVDFSQQVLTFHFNFGNLWPDLLRMEAKEPYSSWQPLVEAGAEEGALKVSFAPIDDARSSLGPSFEKLARAVLTAYSQNPKVLVFGKTEGGVLEFSLDNDFKKSLLK